MRLVCLKEESRCRRGFGKGNEILCYDLEKGRGNGVGLGRKRMECENIRREKNLI